MVKNIIAIIMCLFLFGCITTTKIEPIKIPKIEFQQTEKFKLSETIKKPTKPEYIFLDENYNVTSDVNNAKFLAFTPSEFAKIVTLSSSFDSQNEVIDQLSTLVNIKIQEINALKELISTKEMLSEHITLLYANEQNLRQNEQKNFEIKQLWNKVTFVIQSGVIIALALAL